MHRSVLELVVGGVPYPHGAPDGEWQYRHAVRPDGVTEHDHQSVVDFVAYETNAGRAVSVVADPALSDWNRWTAPAVRPTPGTFPIQCCTNVYPDGCAAELVCHGAPVAAAGQILAEACLRPATVVRGMTGSVLAAASPWGEPADYFDHVMFAHGRCTAPEAVARSRAVGRDLVPADLDAGYPPAVRFYFRWDALAQLADPRFDGVHPVKVRGELRLAEHLVAAVATHADLAEIAVGIDGRLRDRIVVLDLDGPRPEQWATAALAAARTFMS